MQSAWGRALTTMLALGVMLMIFLFSTEPAEKSDITSGRIAERVASMVRPDWRRMEPRTRKAFYDRIQHVVRKCAHFTEFALLGASLRLCLESWLGRKRICSLTAWAVATGYAALDESHQLLVDGRSGQWRDVTIDSAGVLTGILLTVGALALLRRQWKKRAQKKQEPV